MVERTFTEGPDRYDAVTDEDLELYFLGGNDTLLQAQPGGAGTEAYMGTGDDRATLMSGNYAYIEGNDGNDRFDVYNMASNWSYLYAGVGNDLFSIYDGSGNIYAQGEEGNDRFNIGGDATNVYLYGGTGADVFSTEGDHSITGYVSGGDGDDRFYDFNELSEGSLTLYGGAGNDFYRVTDTSVEIREDYYAPGTGNSDSVQVGVGVDYTLAANLERLYVVNFLTEDMEATLVGNDIDNYIDGSAADETIYGLDGNDVLIARGGDDTLYGGRGNDTYYVDRDGDLTIENADEGVDTVRINLSDEVNLTNETTADDVATYVLQANVENLVAGTDIQHNLAGNELDNLIVGRARADTIRGFDGNDTLKGAAGDDALSGGNGNDTLFGGSGNDYLAGDEGNDVLQGNTGADEMRGGNGDDTYYVDNAGDRVVEGEGAGTDFVFVGTSSYTLEDNVENASGYGAGLGGNGVSLFGNTLNNELGGTSAHDLLQDTADGADSFFGGLASDTIISETDGLTDTFVYTNVADSTVASFDSVLGVEGGAGGDLFDLRGVDANSNIDGDQDFVYIGETEFTGNAGELRTTGDFIQGDTDGDGDADFQIQYDTGTGPDLNINNFILTDAIVA